MRDIKAGQSELDVLSLIAETSGLTLRQVSDHFAQERGWSRTTVQKTLDRLIEKGLVERESVEGVYLYRSTHSSAELKSKLVDQFVRRNLGGSLKPFVAYLHGGAEVSEEDLKELKALVEELDRRNS